MKTWKQSHPKLLQGALSFCHDEYYHHFVDAFRYCRENRTQKDNLGFPESPCWIPPHKSIPKGAIGVQWSVSKPKQDGGHVQIIMRSSDKDGNPRKRKRRKTGEEYDSKEYSYYKVYLHNMSLFARGVPTVSHQTVYDNDKLKEVRWTASHLCSVPNCFRPSHIIREPHAVNLSRQMCYTEICLHTPRCMRTIARGKREIQAVIDSNKFEGDDNIDLPASQLSQTFF